MALELKSQCEKCNTALPDESDAYIRSFACTFCSACTDRMQKLCQNCGGELLRRPRRKA